MDPNATTVNIFGQDYTVRGGDDPEYVQEIATYLDERMRELARSSSQVSSSRVAILAALNITDELFRARRSGGGVEDLQERTQRLLHTLESTMAGESAGRSEETGGETLPNT